MTNLYELLRGIVAQADSRPPGAAPISSDHLVAINPEELEWLRNYLTAPDVLINFKARKVGEEPDGEPIMAQDFQIAGDGFEVFAMICEAMINNYQFADMINRANAFYRDHIPTCLCCQKKHFGAKEPEKNWVFSHQPNLGNNGK